MTIKAELGEVQNIKLVDLYLIFTSVKGFCEITSMWDSIEVCLRLVWVTILAGYLMLNNYFEDVRDLIRQSDKHEFYSFICYLKLCDTTL